MPMNNPFNLLINPFIILPKSILQHLASSHPPTNCHHKLQKSRCYFYCTWEVNHFNHICPVINLFTIISDTDTSRYFKLPSPYSTVQLQSTITSSIAHLFPPHFPACYRFCFASIPTGCWFNKGIF